MYTEKRQITVARTRVDADKAHCICCGHKFRFLITKPPITKPGDVYSTAGTKEVAISGLCEHCFDDITSEH